MSNKPHYQIPGLGNPIKADELNRLGMGLKALAQVDEAGLPDPDLTLRVLEGVLDSGGTIIKFAGGNSPTFTAPSTNPRIDLLVIKTEDDPGDLEIIQGTEAADPDAPDYPTGKFPSAEVFIPVGATAIYNTEDEAPEGEAYILKDARKFLVSGGGGNEEISVIAGENIQAGDAVFLGSLQEAKETITQDQNNSVYVVNENDWIAQIFTTSANAKGIKAVWLRHGTSANRNGWRVSIRAVNGGVPTGADLQGKVVTRITTGNLSTWIVIFEDAVEVEPNTQYAVIVGVNPGGNNSGIRYQNTDVLAGGHKATSDDSGASWTAQTGEDMQIRIYESIYSEAEAYKTDLVDYTRASAGFSILEVDESVTTGGLWLTSTNGAAPASSSVYIRQALRVDGFIGFATETKDAGQSVKVKTRGVADGFTDLEIGKPYFLSQVTEGGIQNTPVTPLTEKKRVGVAISDTELLILTPPDYQG